MARFIETSLICMALAAAAAPALAQDPTPLAEFSTLTYTPAVGPENILSTEGVSVSGHLTPAVGLSIDYANESLVIFDATCTAMNQCELTGENTSLVSHTIAGHLWFAFGIADRLQLGLDLPLVYSTGDSFSFTRPDGGLVSVPGGSAFGVADPRLLAKLRILGSGQHGASLGVSAFVTAPLGQATAEDRFLGDDSLTFGGQLIGEYETSGFHLAVNLGGFYRNSTALFSTEIGSQLTYQAAVAYDVTPLVSVAAELQGATAFGGQLDENPLEARLAGYLNQGDFSFHLGAGAGLIRGSGVPLFRVLGGVSWAPVSEDSDGDGIEDSEDACPSEPEDEDGYLDDDGCPEADNDGDGLLDADDPCPDQAEDMDGTDDEDGCPDEDDDGDGIPDGYDSCPNEPEDMDGDRDDDGCPDQDRDRDGVPDDEDPCPDDPEDTDGFGDEDGCPEEDFDGDGILDVEDECPGEAELFNGVSDTDGCPEPDRDGDGIADEGDRCPDQAETLNGQADDDGCPDGEALVRVENGTIQISEELQFRTGRGDLRGPRTNLMVNTLALLLRRTPALTRIRIEGHGRDPELWASRAEAIKARLVAAGIDGSRIDAGSRTDADAPAGVDILIP